MHDEPLPRGLMCKHDALWPTFEKLRTAAGALKAWTES